VLHRARVAVGRTLLWFVDPAEEESTLSEREQTRAAWDLYYDLGRFNTEEPHAE
jgi:hypothetical protein